MMSVPLLASIFFPIRLGYTLNRKLYKAGSNLLLSSSGKGVGPEEDRIGRVAISLLEGRLTPVMLPINDRFAYRPVWRRMKLDWRAIYARPRPLASGPIE